MRRPSPVLHITFALTLLGCAALVSAQWLWHLFPDPEQREAGWRRAHAESAAAQTLFMLERGLLTELDRTLTLAVKADARIRSIGIRRADGSLAAHSADHDAQWAAHGANQHTRGAAANGERSPLTHVAVPIRSHEALWGQLEMTFAPPVRGPLATLAKYPLAVAVAHFLLLAGLLYWLYLRRALVQLDPGSVIPARIRAAYDIMTEGVALLDGRGRILMVNGAFDRLPAGRWPDVVGKRLSSLPWLAAGLPADASQHPWAQVLRNCHPSTGHEVRIGEAAAMRRVLINCAPIADEHGRARGCIVTFDDVSALQVINEKLTATLAELQTSKREIERQNLELERLATRDALSGCLSRRAGLERAAAALADARRDDTPLSCMVIDIDHFKTVNDSFGHAVGDGVVQTIGAVLDGTLADDVISARLGGDEFFAVIPGRSARAAHDLAENLRTTVRRQVSREMADGRALQVSVSIGVAQWNPDTMSDLAALIAAADEGLYEAKAQGRDCVRSTGGIDEAPSPPACAPMPADLHS